MDSRAKNRYDIVAKVNTKLVRKKDFDMQNWLSD
jgi:hypothetical protein